MNRCIGKTAIVCTLAAGILGNAGLADGPQIPSGWESLDSAGLLQLAEDLSAQGAGAAGQRMLLADYIAGKHMGDVESARAVPIERWRYLGRALKDDIPPETRKVWTSMLSKAFDDSDETIDALSVQDMVDLRNALWWVGHDAPIRHTPKLVERVESTADWYSLKPLDLAGLVFPLRDVGASGRVARQRLAEHVTSKYFADVAATRSMPLLQWQWLAENLATELSPETRTIWAGKLKEAFTSDAAVLASLSSKDNRRLVNSLRGLGAKAVNSLALAWLKDNRGTWPQRSAGGLARIAIVAAKEDRSELASLMPELDALWAARAEEAPLGSVDYSAIVEVWTTMGNRSKAREWALSWPAA